jgi:hypothetical protein
MLSRLPETTRKILMFVPYHSHRHGAPDSLIAANWRECKDRIVEIAGGHANIVVLDFMIASPITVEDRNYWDDVHFTTEIAEQVVRMIAAAANGRPAEDGAYLILAGS